MRLFADYELRSYLNDTDRKIAYRVDKLTNDEIMANDLGLLCDSICEEFGIEPLSVKAEDINRRRVDNGKIRKWFDPVRYWTENGRGEWRDVDGVTLTFTYPFSGTPMLLRCQASTYMMSDISEVDVGSNYISITLQYPIEETNNPEWKSRVNGRVSGILEFINKNVSWINDDLRGWCGSLRTRVLTQLEGKKSRVESYYAAAKLFDVSPRINSVGAQIISMQKKRIPIAHSYLAEEERYCISDGSYEEALAVIKQTASTWERTPNSYRGMGEEDLRNVLLSSLNAWFDGRATGEAFRHKGKTDICIEEKNRAAFVAECKMWTGEKHIAAALSQLDGYTTWRDCKVALIYFVRRKDFVSVTEKAQAHLEVMDEVRDVKILDRNEFRCKMISSVNVGRLMDVRVLLFNLYTEE